MVADQLEGGGAVAAELRGSSARRAAARRARVDTHRHRTPARPGNTTIRIDIEHQLDQVRNTTTIHTTRTSRNAAIYCYM